MDKWMDQCLGKEELSDEEMEKKVAECLGEEKTERVDGDNIFKFISKVPLFIALLLYNSCFSLQTKMMRHRIGLLHGSLQGFHIPLIAQIMVAVQHCALRLSAGLDKLVDVPSSDNKNNKKT